MVTKITHIRCVAGHIQRDRFRYVDPELSAPDAVSYVSISAARGLHSQRSVATTKKPSLLIVDDDAPIRKLLERIALRAGFEVGMAKDGIEALEQLAERHYDIAIVDLMMPRLSGYDLVQQVSTMNPRPVILVATALTNADVAKIDDTLVRRVIRKPFDIKAVGEALIETARQLAERQAAVDKGLPVAPPEAAVIRVSAEELAREIDEENAKQKAEAEEAKEKQPNGDRPVN